MGWGERIHTLELDISGEWGELCYAEASVVVNVCIWQGTRGGECGQVEGSDD